MLKCHLSMFTRANTISIKYTSSSTFRTHSHTHALWIKKNVWMVVTINSLYRIFKIHLAHSFIVSLNAHIKHDKECSYRSDEHCKQIFTPIGARLPNRRTLHKNGFDRFIAFLCVAAKTINKNDFKWDIDVVCMQKRQKTVHSKKV